MKINRKYLTQCMIAFLILIAGMFVMDIKVNADTAPTFIIDEKASGENLTAVVSFTPGQCAAGTIKLSFNTDTLEYVSFEQLGFEIGNVNVNYMEESKIIAINFFNTYGEVSGDTRLAEISFRIKGDRISSSEISVDSFKLYDINSSLLSEGDSTPAEITFDSKNILEKIEVVTDSQNGAAQANETNGLSDEPDSSEKAGWVKENTTDTADTRSQNDADIEDNTASQNNTDTQDNTQVQDDTSNQNGAIDKNSSTEKTVSDPNDNAGQDSMQSQNNKSNKNSQAKKTTGLTIGIAVVAVIICVAAGVLYHIRKKKEDSKIDEPEA